MMTGMAAMAALKADEEYYIWLNIYEKLLGSNEAGDGPALSAYGTKSDGYVFVAENSGKSGYVLLRQKSSGKYLAASSSNAWSVTLENKSTDDRFCWKADEGTYTYIINKKNSKYLGIDGANKGSDYVSVYYDKAKGSHSQYSIIPATGSDWDEARQAYESGVYQNAQGVNEVDYCQLNNKTIDRSDAVDIHITANANPIMGNSSINLGSERTWLIIDNIVPSQVISNYLKFVTINGARAQNGSNCRVAIFLNGAAVIPTPDVPMTCEGTEGSFTLNVGNNANLGELNNTMTSFTLRRGYMATVASGTNGSGHSRVYVADHKDLTVTLPTALARRVSSVNVKNWQYVSKKGWGDTAGTSKGPQLRATWYWSWSAGYNSNSDMEYVPCRQHRYWPSASEVNSKTATASLSLNEPEHPEQHTSDKCSCGGTINEWTAYGINKDFQAGGGRIGSPQPTDFGYLTKYFEYIDQNNNESRCDFAVTHAYWNIGSRDAASYANFMASECQRIYNNTGRPVWLTEMEAGASWSGYADAITSYDKARQYLQAMLEKLDECDYVERYAIYAFDFWRNRMFYDDGGITPAGQVYRDHRATFAYNSAYTKTPVWWNPSAKKPSVSATYDSTTGTATFTVNNPNTDFTDQLIVEMSTNGSSWTQVATLSDRSQLDNSVVVLDGVSISGVAAGAQFRARITTLAGGTATSDAFKIGSLVNGNVNATSYSEIYGWTCTRGAQNGYTKDNSGDTYFEVWHPTADGMSFDYYQEISGLANGVYRLQGKVFNSSNNVSGATVNDAVGLYAQSAGTTWFAPVSKDSEIDGADMLTLNNIVVTNGNLRIGVRNLKAMTARWAGADDFSLTYLGTTENILGKSDEEAIAEARATFLAQMPAGRDDSRDFSYFIHNPEVTSITEGWTTASVKINSGESYDYKNSDPKNTYFDYYDANNTVTSTAEQTIENLPRGSYVLSAMLRGSTSTMSLSLEASAGNSYAEKTLVGTGNTGNMGNKGWHEVTLDAITLNEGESLTIRLSATGSTWWSADHFTLMWSPLPDDPTVGITEATSGSTAEGTLYDLQGRRVNHAAPGVYLKGGKKYIRR